MESSERDKAPAVGEVLRDHARGLQSEPRLANPARAGEREQPDRIRTKPVNDRLEIVLAANRSVGRHRQPAVATRARTRRRGLGVERVGVAQDVVVQLAQRLAGLDAELIHQPRAGGEEGLQRVGLPPRAI